jgi:hypothetical protein
MEDQNEGLEAQMEPWSARPVVADSHHLDEEQDPNPDLDPH